MTTVNELVKEWRAMGPARWAEHKYGWIMPGGKPITLESWQRAILDAWWEHRETVTTLAVSNVKKVGKTSLNAILTAWRWLCLPGEHFSVANDLDQSQSRQFKMIADAVKRHAILDQNTRITRSQLEFTPTGSTLDAIAVDAAGSAGSNHWTVSHTEAWGIIYESGVRAWEELTPPPGRLYGLPALRIADSYCGWLGESEVWHGLVDRGLAGDLVSDDWPIYKSGATLLFHMEDATAQERCFRGSESERLSYYSDQAETLRPGAFARVHLNKRGESESAFVPLAWWRACRDKELGPLEPNKTIRVYAGVDCARSVGGDDAAVIGVYRHPQTRRVCVAWHKVWRGGKRRKAELRLDTTVAPYLRLQAARYRLVSVSYDPRFFVTISHQLRDVRIPMHEITQSLPVLGPIGQKLFNLIQTKGIAYYPHSDLDNLTAGASAKEVLHGLHIKKGRGAVDLLVALSFACSKVKARGSSWWRVWNGRMGPDAIYYGPDGVLRGPGAKDPYRDYATRPGPKRKWTRLL